MMNKTELAIVVVSILALLISCVSTYINFFYHKNELTIVANKMSVSPDSTFTIGLAWVNSGNKSISITDISLNSADEELNSLSRNEDYETISSLFLKPGDIIKKSISVKRIVKNLNQKYTKNLALSFSIISSGGTYKEEKLLFGKTAIDKSIFTINGPFFDLKTDLSKGITNSSSKDNNIVKFSL